MNYRATRDWHDGGERKSIEELRAANLPHCTYQTAGLKNKGGTAPALLEDLNTYFNGFVAPSGGESPCICCGAHHAGFTWGIAHGHGHCYRCSWPATAYHFIRDRTGADLCTFRGAILQVHPDFVERRKPEPPR